MKPMDRSFVRLYWPSVSSLGVCRHTFSGLERAWWRRGVFAGAIALLAISQLAAQPSSPAPVRLEVVMLRGVDPAIAHDFAETYAEAGIDLRIRAMRINDEVEIKNVGTTTTPSYLVVGFLTNERRLILPGGEFGIRDSDRVKAMLRDLAQQGPDALVGERMVFGLTGAQLLEVNELLSQQVAESTQGVAVRELVRQFSEELGTRIVIDPSANQALEDGLIFEDELQGLSIGTALAAAVRPAGLVLTVRKDESRVVRLVLIDGRRAEEFWPIGWPYEQNPSVIAPVLAERIKVSITDFRLNEALAAIQAKIEIPMLIDRNSLAEAGIELDEIMVSYSHDSAPYSAILTKLLAQANPPLRFELRLDENEKPFLWIFTRPR